ncbi:MAG TPA: heme-binding domain-containing protein [Anaerolineae bacterium]|jgi:mono/diheme cytochrome c family protein
MRSLRTVGVIVLAVLGFFLLIQFIPYGRAHTNPAVLQEPAWDSAQTRELAQRACFDCHSNETTWPWYSDVAPISWLIQRDVEDGRRRLNFSEWNLQQRGARNAAETVQNGSMPPWFYIPIHPAANLSAADKAALIKGLQATFGSGN